MKKIALERQNINNIDFEKLYELRDSLKKFLDENADVENPEYLENLNSIFEFVDDKGSFSLLDSFKVGSDMRVDFCYMPTYICTAVLMKALLHGADTADEKIAGILPKTLKMCCGRNLRGHGYEAFAELLEAVKIFVKGEVNEFLDKYHDLCPEFTRMFERIMVHIAERVNDNYFTAGWGDDLEEDIREINEYFADNRVFVYGTLLEGEANHRLMESNELIGRGEVAGHDMYDLGYYPGIVPGKGTVKGEIYKVDNINEIDSLEGEGFLYLRKTVPARLEDGRTCMVYVYVYNHGVSDCEKIPYELQPYTDDWKGFRNGYVWYVSYGSNMLKERLACYVKGGFCEHNGKTYTGCADKTMPERDVPVEIPYNMFFSNYNEGSWENSAVAFLDTAKPGKAIGRAFLVTEEQFRDIHRQEGPGIHWYSKTVRLDDIAGIPAYTFTNGEEKIREPIEMVSEAYKEVIMKGIRQMHPDMSKKKIRTYIESCV